MHDVSRLVSMSWLIRDGSLPTRVVSIPLGLAVTEIDMSEQCCAASEVVVVSSAVARWGRENAF